MEKISLSEYVKQNGQAKTANLIGVHQTAISKALRAGRKIFLVRQEDGSYKAEECRPFPSQKPSESGKE
ncbi:Cro/Cl family transcriptional regulator [Xenorhabdus stockiae]|uniref:Cro/Cl family transcriptional regulator n=1 Tax=Xenorhabdus stockiae TaxID=351614 RepID=A0A2D0KKR1_9GAMM|nr:MULTISPECIES: Cro/CI family transcriptional regulator [Xenorhabdus]PHM63978.1 Cro/Cl family transcriptional regulator [Xenorhabdus stockiae]PHM72546.1 Cro/Cl family transcriptional regulator [Xenorhabdus sp. KJ12.1]